LPAKRRAGICRDADEIERRRGKLPSPIGGRDADRDKKTMQEKPKIEQKWGVLKGPALTARARPDYMPVITRT
jgi:hypothetical protein